MKDQMKNHVEPEETFSETLKSVVQKIEVNASFKAELGKQLMEAHQPAPVNFILSAFNRAMPAFGWIFALALMALVLNWVFRSIALPAIPAAQETSISSAQETPSSIPTETPMATFDYTVRSGDTCGGMAAAFGVSVQSIVIVNNLPTTCIISVNQVLKIPYPTPLPSPIPNEFTTPAPDGEGYDWRGAKLYLAQPLPESPAEANVYQLRKDQQITPEESRALASRFGLQGEIYTSYDYVFSVNDYYFTDGKQALEVYSNRRFIYTADLAKARTVTESAQSDDAERIIREFLNVRGFDFPFKITPTDFFGGYNLELLAPDGLSIQYES